jgi:D-amino-acid oxidase
MTSRDRGRVAVIGSGVIGLTSAICLAEAGFEVRIITATMPGGTTSASAGAIWGPFEVAGGDRTQLWARQTLAELLDFTSITDTGVGLVRGIQASEKVTLPPEWSAEVGQFEPCPVERLPASYLSGWRFSVPIIDMSRHLAYLLDRFQSIGGQIEVRHVEQLGIEARNFAVLVNCSGIGAHELAHDRSVHPARGQVVIAENPGIEEFFVATRGNDPKQLYVLPHGDTVTLGGTFERGNWSTTPDPATTDQIVDRCAAVWPGLRDAAIVEHRVGLRPCRPTVRLEVSVEHGMGIVVHNYGHGGAGVSLAWGCAREAVTLALSAVGS